MIGAALDAFLPGVVRRLPGPFFATVDAMPRRSIVPLSALVLALGLAAAGCGGTGDAAPGTITKYVTAIDTVPASGGAGQSGQGGQTEITVVNPSGSGDTGSAGESGAEPGTGTSPAPTDASAPGSGADAGGSTTTPPTGTTGTTEQTSTSSSSSSSSSDKKVDPLTSSCASLLDNGDINKALGSKGVSAEHVRIVDVENPDVHMTGRIKCYYGTEDISKARPVAVALAQYATVDAAQAQLTTTVSSEKDLGAKASTADVSGKQADILLRDGGFLILRYDTWTLSIAVDKGVTDAGKLPDGLQSLAKMVLARIVNA